MLPGWTRSAYLSSWYAARIPVPSRVAGKGIDLDAAKASGVMESIEGYHAERITLPLKLGTYETCATRIE